MLYYEKFINFHWRNSVYQQENYKTMAILMDAKKLKVETID